MQQTNPHHRADPPSCGQRDSLHEGCKERFHDYQYFYYHPQSYAGGARDGDGLPSGYSVLVCSFSVHDAFAVIGSSPLCLVQWLVVWSQLRTFSAAGPPERMREMLALRAGK